MPAVPVAIGKALESRVFGRREAPVLRADAVAFVVPAGRCGERGRQPTDAEDGVAHARAAGLVAENLHAVHIAVDGFVGSQAGECALGVVVFGGGVGFEDVAQMDRRLRCAEVREVLGDELAVECDAPVRKGGAVVGELSPGGGRGDSGGDVGGQYYAYTDTGVYQGSLFWGIGPSWGWNIHWYNGGKGYEIHLIKNNKEIKTLQSGGSF